MRGPLRIAILAAAALVGSILAGCGDGDRPRAEPNTIELAKEGREPDKPASKIKGTNRPPKVTVPPGAPPKKLVVRDLRKGFGVAAKHGHRLSVQHVGVNYKTGQVFETFWGDSGPFSFNFGAGEVRDGWETGLKGMRVGGVRELILPSRLAYGTGPLLYVVELVGIERD